MVEKLKIFLASSNELHSERDMVELLVCRRNKSLVNRGMFFDIVRWEELLQSFGDSSAQERFSAEIPNCSVMIVLFHKRVGEFTKEEFDIAYNNFKQGNNPRHIFVYFKITDISMRDLNPEIIKILEMREQIKNDKQIYIEFETLSDLQNSLNTQLNRLDEWFERQLAKITIPDSKILIEAAKIPVEPEASISNLSKSDVENIINKIGLQTETQINPHLKFEEGDISYFYEQNLSKLQLELEFRSRKMVLDMAEESGTFINEPGDLSQKAKPIKARLLKAWRDKTMNENKE